MPLVHRLDPHLLVVTRLLHALVAELPATRDPIGLRRDSTVVAVISAVGADAYLNAAGTEMNSDAQVAELLRFRRVRSGETQQGDGDELGDLHDEVLLFKTTAHRTRSVPRRSRTRGDRAKYLWHPE